MRSLERQKRNRNIAYAVAGLFFAGVDAFAAYTTYQAFTVRPDLKPAVIPVDIMLGGIDGAILLSYFHYMPRIPLFTRMWGLGDEPRNVRRDRSRSSSRRSHLN